jgi:hypothetical protein
MSRAKWLFVGLVLVVAGCATGSSVEDENPPEDDSGSSAPADATGDSHKADANGAHDVGTADTTTNNGDDTGTGGGDDTGTGEDTSTGDDAGVDGNEPDTNVPDTNEPDTNLPDTNVPDTNAPDTSIPDAGHDAHDANVPDTNVPDTNLPDTNLPDTNLPDTNIPDTNIPDTNLPDTNAPDTGSDAGCSPVGTGYTKVTHAPASAPLSCTSGQASSFYTACMTGTKAACATWEAANGSCASCLEGAIDPSGSTWGVYTQWPLSSSSSVIELDIGGCLIQDGKSSTCAHDFEYLTECEHYYCGQSCYGNSFTHYQDCVTAADKNQCLTEYNNVYVLASPCTASIFASTCLNWSDFQSGFLAVASVMCE